MQVVSMARFGQKQQRWGLMKARWERGLRLEASERLYVMRSGQQSVLDAAQRRRSGAVADASREYGQIWPKAAKVGLDEGQMGERAASGGLGEALCDAQRTAVGPGCSPEKTVRRRG
jgi:hypothetical protein